MCANGHAPTSGVFDKTTDSLSLMPKTSDCVSGGRPQRKASRLSAAAYFHCGSNKLVAPLGQ
jgi:hypothetical protein